MTERKPPKSVDLESGLSADLKLERGKLEGEFSKNTEIIANVASRERILELASMGEFGIARSLITEQLGAELDDEGLLETMALLESYYADEEEFPWCESLIEIYPRNSIAGALRGARGFLSSGEWGKIQEKSTLILDVDGRNWFALKASAASYSALGQWDKASSKWRELSKIRDLTNEEEYDAARSSYNAKRFSEVIEIASKRKRFDKNEIKLLELLTRSYYNLRMDEECVDYAIRILELEPESEIGLRSQSRSLFRLGRLTEAIPIIEEYCRIFPFSVNAWETLIETKLMMDKVEESKEAWIKLRDEIGEESKRFFTAVEISLRFNWREEYLSIIHNEGKKFNKNADFAENIAEINIKLGDIGGAWRILSSNGIEPMKSLLGMRFREVIGLTNTNIEEIENASESGESMWITELVTREILRKAIHNVKNRHGVGTYFDELDGLEDKVFDLGKFDFENDKTPGKGIIERYSDLLGLLDSGVKMKVVQLISHFASFQPDLVHAWQDETILTSCIAGALTGVPVVLGSARSLRPDEKTELHIRKRPYLRNCYREIFNYDCHNLSTNSIAGKNSYAEWIGMAQGNIIVNENGVDFDEIESRMNKAEIDQRLRDFGFSEENKIVGGIFRLEAGKRPKLWIEGFEEARQIDQSLRGVIVGGGRMEKSVREWVMESELGEFVKVVGEVSDVGSWLSIMDVFLFTSVTEGLPNVLIEAQGFGVPVVSTRVGGVSEVTGSLVDTASSELLGKAIIELFSDESFQETRLLAKKVARERFSVFEMASRTVEMYSRVLALPDGEG